MWDLILRWFEDAQFLLSVGAIKGVYKQDALISNKKAVEWNILKRPLETELFLFNTILKKVTQIHSDQRHPSNAFVHINQ